MNKLLLLWSIFDSALIRENAGQRKPLFWNILHSDLSGFANLSANNFIYI